MLVATDLSNAFAMNTRVIKMQAEGLSHEDSLRQLPFRGNCLNFVLGHILQHRQLILGFLKQPHTIDDSKLAIYQRGSVPIDATTEGVLSLEQLLTELERAQTSVSEALSSATPEDLAAPAGNGTRTLGQQIFFLYFHETYHTGQTELLRQLSGVNDQVI